MSEVATWGGVVRELESYLGEHPARTWVRLCGGPGSPRGGPPPRGWVGVEDRLGHQGAARVLDADEEDGLLGHGSAAVVAALVAAGGRIAAATRPRAALSGHGDLRHFNR